MPGPGMELVGEEEIREILDVLQSGYLYRYQVGQDARFQGKVVKLEQEMARRSQVRPCANRQFRHYGAPGSPAVSKPDRSE